jgi:hypothetical protein
MMIASCSDVGIFYTLEIEEEIEDNNNLNDSAVFSNLVDTDSSSTSGYYIGNAGPSIYYRSKGSSYSSWSKLSVPTSGYASDATNSSMVLVGDDLFISRISYDGDYVVSGIYCLPDAASNLDSPTWTTITENLDGEDDDFVFYNLFTANGYLYVNELEKDDDDDEDDLNTTDSFIYVSTATPDVDTYDHIGTSYTEISNDVGLDSTEHLIKVIYETTSTSYWLIYNDTDEDVIAGYAYYDTDPYFATSTNTKNVSSNMYSDIFFYDDDDDDVNDCILLSDVDGSIYIYDLVDTDWSTIDVDDPDIDCMYRGFANIEDLVNDTVIVGTSAYDDESGVGYYQIDMSSLSIDEDDDFSDNYSSTDLDDSSIAGFLMDSQNDRLFAYTENEGVWLNVSDEWSLE